MARENEASALELHIKVNGQNLSTISKKCNIGTLRPPSDLSWPKIPLRRLNHNTDDIIEPPCVVTLIETPRKGRSIVQAGTCQHTRSRLNQKYEVPTHIPKRLPGSVDPRFKKQISTRQKAEKPDESYCDTRNGKQMAEMNMYALQEEPTKPENRLQGAIESVNNCTRYNANKFLESVTKKEGTIDCPIKEQFVLSEADHRKTVISQHVINERCDLEDRFFQVQKQETGRPLLLMVDEKKIHALPINTLNIEAASTAQPLQCYNVQIPVVAYNNVPIQIPNIPMQMQDDIKIECQSDSAMKNPKSVGNIYDAISSTLANLTSGSKEYENEKYPLNGISEHNLKNDNISGKKSISHCETSDWIHDKENVNSNVSLNQDTLLDKSHNENFNTMEKDTKDGESISNLPSAGTLRTIVEQTGCNTDKKTLSETGITKISLRPNRTETEQKLMYREKISRLDESLIVMNNKTLKRTPINFSRKAKSFFRKKSRLAITDSDCTLILPGSRHVKGKQYERTRLKVSQLLRKKNGISDTNSNIIRIKSNNAKQGRRMNLSCSLTNLQTKGDLFEEPSSIPLETQELLNQSYWEYYWRLRRKIALADKPDNAGERDKSHPSKEPRECLPESQTLQQCSVLSCMINTALRDSTAADGRSSSDPIVPTNARDKNICQEDPSGLTSGVFAKKMKRRKTKRVSKRLLGLRTIALLGTMIYFAVIFLPMMYDYFFDEKYENDYENANYIGLALQYVISSFGEAFDGIVDVLNTVLLRPRPCGKCNNVI